MINKIICPITLAVIDQTPLCPTLAKLALLFLESRSILYKLLTLYICACDTLGSVVVSRDPTDITPTNGVAMERQWGGNGVTIGWQWSDNGVAMTGRPIDSGDSVCWCLPRIGGC